MCAKQTDVAARKRIATVGPDVSAMNVITYHSNKLKTLLMTKRSDSDIDNSDEDGSSGSSNEEIETEIIITETVDTTLDDFSKQCV